MRIVKSGTALLALGLALAPGASSANALVMYGDADGFGVGATTFTNVNVNNASPGEAAGTDVRLIGGIFIAPAFQPTATLSFAPQAGITSITITMAMAEFGGNTAPVGGPNVIMIDGVAVPVAFLNSFPSVPFAANPNIETQTFALDPSFFPLFADGSIDLTGTRITERESFSSFQIDYISFDVRNSAVPEPGTLALLGLAMTGLVAVRRRKT